MAMTSNLLGVTASILLLLTVLEMLRRGKLRERHTIWWIIASLLSLTAGIFPSVLDSVASTLGVEIPANLVFFVATVVLFLVCIQQSSELTRLEERTRVLAEKVALLENRMTSGREDAQNLKDD